MDDRLRFLLAIAFTFGMSYLTYRIYTQREETDGDMDHQR